LLQQEISFLAQLTLQKGMDSQQKEKSDSQHKNKIKININDKND
jgi:hypothetical protein